MYKEFSANQAGLRNDASVSVLKPLAAAVQCPRHGIGHVGVVETATADQMAAAVTCAAASWVDDDLT